MTKLFNTTHADPLQIYASTAKVLVNNDFVELNSGNVTALAKQIIAADTQQLLPICAQFHCRELDDWKFSNYLMLVEALNFCFWDDVNRWQMRHEQTLYNGYNALIIALHNAIYQKGWPLWDAHWLNKSTLEDWKNILRGDVGEIPLLENRFKNIKELADVLLTKWNGWVLNMITQAQGDAIAIVKNIIAELPSFHDECVYSPTNTHVYFYKRAQIFVADWVHFKDRHIQHHSLPLLTAFADYKLPQLLRQYGIINYCPELAHAVDTLQPLPQGSAEEISIRSATIWAVEWLRCACLDQGQSISAQAIDGILWRLSQNSLSQPYHRTRTIFY